MPPAPQVQISPPALPQRIYPFSAAHPPVSFAPEPRIQDSTMEDVEIQNNT